MRHALRETTEVHKILTGGHGNPIVVNLWRLPVPVLDMAIEEREVATVSVAIRRQRIPGIYALYDPVRLFEHVPPGINALLVFIDEDKNTRWRWDEVL